jgi:hypothetical protein
MILSPMSELWRPNGYVAVEFGNATAVPEYERDHVSRVITAYYVVLSYDGDGVEPSVLGNHC